MLFGMLMQSRPSRCLLSIIVAKNTRHAATAVRLQSNRGLLLDDDFEEALNNDQAYRRPVLQWYPGHIAKAERQLQETIKAVDVVLEVRDARIPQATQHLSIPTWCAGKPRIAVMTHQDVVPREALNAWKRAIQNEKHIGITDKQIQHQADQATRERIKYEPDDNKDTTTSLSGAMTVCCVNAKHGEGILALKKVIQKTGQYVHARREARGLLARPLRVGVLGYPNTGKSALINRIVNRRRARTANTPGVTRSLQWIRVKGESDFELLDSPGIIPASLDNQEYAKLLAVCNCIGQAAYDTQAIAAFCCERLLHMRHAELYAPDWHRLFRERYKIAPMGTGEDMLFAVADSTCRGSPEDAARKILQDARTGRMGPICWEAAPMFGEDHDQETLPIENERYRRQEDEDARLERQRIGRQALEAAQDRGVELPAINVAQDVGKGMFEGW